MTGPIDEAYVEIKPDLKNFDREVKRELDSSFDKIENKLDDLYDVIDKQFDRLIVVLDAHFGNLQHTADDTFNEIQDFARDAGRSIATDIELGTKVAKHEIDDLADNAHHDFNRIQKDARGSGFSIAGMFSTIGKAVGSLISNIASVGSQIGDIGGQVGKQVGSVTSSIGSIGSGIGSVLQIAMWGVLVPLVLGLAGALSQLVGILAALPAAAGVAVTAILPLILAFHGFADAIGAVISGDPEKINEALKKLSPSAAKVVKEFQKLVKPFGEIQKIAQEALFKPLVGTLTQLANTVLPALRAGVGPVAGAFGNMFAQIAKAFTGPGATDALNKTFATTVRIIDAFTPSIVKLVDALGSIFVTGLPFVEKFFGVIANGIGSFATWLQKASDGNKVVGWLDKAWTVGKLVWNILKELLQYFGTLLGSFADEGTDSLNGINDALKKMNDYLKSDQGKETLHNLGVIVHWAGNAFVWFLGTITGAWKGLNAFFDFVRGIGPFFSNLWDSIVSGAKAVGNWFVWLGTTIWDAITGAVDAVKGWLDGFRDWAHNLFSTIWDAITNGVKNFVTNSKNALVSFPTTLKTFIVDSIHWVAYQVGYMIGSIIRFFTTDLPNGVRAGWDYVKQGTENTINNLVNFITVTIPALATSFIGWVRDMWASAVAHFDAGVHAALNFLSELPGKAWAYVQDLQSRVNNTISNLWHSAVQFIKNMVNDIVSEVKKLPGQVVDAWNGLIDKAYNLGQDIVKGLANGIKSLGGWLKEQAANLAHDAWQGAKDAIGANSPSKEFAKLGVWSVQGFVNGFNSMDIAHEVGRAIKIPVTNLGNQMQRHAYQNSPKVSVGGASITAFLSVDGSQFHPVVVQAMYDNAQDVALAAEQGGTQLSRRR